MERSTNKVFDFIQRKVEYENFRFKYPSLIGVVLESITSRIIDTQKMIGSVNYRFHISESLTLGEIGEVLKFKINTLISDDMMKLGIKDKVIMFNDSTSLFEGSIIKDLYYKHRDEDGWIYIDFIIDSPHSDK